MSQPDDEGKKGPGRKRDPTAAPRILAAAVEVYARDGWAGFTFESVARQAKIGKPAIYLRWSTREELLDTALQTISETRQAADTGSLRGDLHEWVRRTITAWATTHGLASLRMQIDSVSHPELRERYRERVMLPLVASARGIVDRAIARGELPSDVDGDLLLEILNGAPISHMIATPVERRAKLIANADAYAERLIEMTLRGAADSVAKPNRMSR